MSTSKNLETSFYISIITLTVSIAASFYIKQKGITNPYGYCLLYLWTIGPPIWFFFEYVILFKGKTEQEIERKKHIQDLARNIWVAFVLLLAWILEIDFPIS